MSSAWLLMSIVGIWALLVIPVWLRDRRAEAAVQVSHFRSAMEQLGDSKLLPDLPRPNAVSGKRAPRAGTASRLRKRALRQRRNAFLIAVSTWPIALLLQISGFVPATIWVMPPLGFVTFVGYARYSLARVRRMTRAANATARTVAAEVPAVAVEAPVDRAAEFAPRPSRRSEARPQRGLGAALAAIQRSAMRKLLATEPVIETSATPSWQPAETQPQPTSTWSAPETVLPAYVSAPAATTVPRVIDRMHGTWDGKAMVEAARAQQLADFVSEIREAAPIDADGGDFDQDSATLHRIIGA